MTEFKRLLRILGRSACFALALAVCLSSFSFLFGCGGTDPSADPSAEPSGESSVPEEPKTPDETVSEALTNLRSELFGWTEPTPLKGTSLWKEADTCTFQLDCPSLIVGTDEWKPGVISGSLFGRDGTMSLRLEGNADGTPIGLLLTAVESVFYLSVDNVTDDPIRISPEDLKSLMSEAGIVPDESRADETDPEKWNEKLSGLKDAFKNAFDAAPFTASKADDGSDVYTKTIGGDLLKDVKTRFADLMGDLQSLTESLDSGETLPEDDSSAVTFNLDIERLELSCILSEDGFRSGIVTAFGQNDRRNVELEANASGKEEEKGLRLTLRNDGKAVLESTLTVRKNGDKVLTNLSVSLPENDLSATASLTWFDLSEAGASFTGDLSVTQKQNGLLITLPASFDGGFSAGDGKADFRLHFAVKAQGVLDTEFSLTLSLQKTDTDIAAPEKSVPLSEILQGPTDLLKKMTERYPELMKSVSGLFASKQSISFVTADYAMAFDWYSDGTAVYSACFPFEDTGKEIVLSYEGYEIIRIPYRKSGGTVQILGYELDLYEGEGYESFYRDGADFGIEMYTNGLAFLIAAQPWDGSVDELKLSFPDGTKYSYELIWGEDGTTVTVKGGPVFHMVSQTDVDTV